MRVGLVEWPDGLQADDGDWAAIAKAVRATSLDVLITNELPFGEWIAAQPAFDRHVAQRSVDVHLVGLAALAALPVSTVVTSRPVWAGKRLANEAVVLRGGDVQPWRRKRYFPAEPGWFETEWYVAGRDGFATAEVEGTSTGILLCTEAMFNERARHYGRAGAGLIVIPRATGSGAMWRAAGQMAAIVSGSYVVSSNRRDGKTKAGFGGDGFAYAPDGTLLTATSAESWLAVIETDFREVDRQKQSYPCYVSE